MLISASGGGEMSERELSACLEAIFQGSAKASSPVNISYRLDVSISYQNHLEGREEKKTPPEHRKQISD